MGFGSTPGWTLVGRALLDPLTIAWRQKPAEGVLDVYDTAIIFQLEEVFKTFFSEYKDVIIQEKLEEESDWALL
jgi:hypothetical protein